MTRAGCERFGELLTAHLDDELERAERESFAAHLDRCSACRADLEGLRRLAGTLAALPGLEPSGGFEAAVLRSIPAARHARRPRWARRAVLALVAGGAVAAALLLALPKRVAVSPAELADLGVAANLDLFENYEAVDASDALKGAEDVAVVANLDRLVPPEGDRR